jgi:hypothetical protein
VVFVDQPAEYIFTLDPRRRLDALIRVVVRWQLFAALMRAMVVVLRMEDGEYLGRVPVPQDESVVQALSAHGARRTARRRRSPAEPGSGLDDAKAA